MFYKPKNLLPGKTLEDMHKIRYRNPKKVPVQIRIEGNKVLITAYVRFSEELQRQYHNRGEYPEEREKPFSHYVLSGIRKYWAKEYDIPGVDGKVEVTTDLVTDIPQGQESFLIRRARFSNTSYVSSPWPRWGWGVFKTLCPESAMLNWSLTSPGRINMNLWFTKKNYEAVSAHEFGHILGIGDAYDAHYRFYYEAPDTKDYMMNSDTCVAPQELLMVLKAHETGRMQYFPYKFIPKVYFGKVFGNVKKKIKRKARKMKRN